MGAQGTATIDFGTYPGSVDAVVAVTGQSGIVSGSLVEAWILPAVTTDHSIAEHYVDPPFVIAGEITAGTGFNIRGFGGYDPGGTVLTYGKWNVAWVWNQMAPIGTIQAVGTGGASEVELNNLAQRYVIRPQDFGLLGEYSAGGTYTIVLGRTTTIAAGNLVAMRIVPGYLCLIKKVYVSLILTLAGTGSAGIASNSLFRAHNVIQAYTASTATPTATQLISGYNSNKLRSNMPDPALLILMPSSATGTAVNYLTSASGSPEVTPIVEPIALSTVSGAAPLSSGSPFFVNAPLLDCRAGEMPVLLQYGDGLIVHNDIAIVASAATTLDFSIFVQWDELELRTYQ